MYTFVFLYKLLIYRGFNFIVTHVRHLGWQWRVHPQRVVYKEKWELFIGVAFIIGGLSIFIFVLNKHLLGILFGHSFLKHANMCPSFGIVMSWISRHLTFVTEWPLQYPQWWRYHPISLFPQVVWKYPRPCLWMESGCSTMWHTFRLLQSSPTWSPKC